ncbi:hypothetical protein COOONC_15848 [Cooperia oncophora]
MFLIDFVLEDMPHEAGWTRGRLLDFWVAGADYTMTMRVESVVSSVDSKQLSPRWRLIADGYVRLAKLTKSANPANEAVSRMLHIVSRVEPGTTGHRILDMVYHNTIACTPASAQDPGSADPSSALPDTFRLKQRSISLTHDQRLALRLGMTDHPIAEIQAAFGTGKTFLGAVIAGLPRSTQKGTHHSHSHHQHRCCSLRLHYASSRGVPLGPSLNLRFATSPLPLPSTSMKYSKNFADSLKPQERDSCSRFRKGRLLYEQYARDPDRTMNMTESEIDGIYIG